MSPNRGPLPIAFCITELDRGGAERALTQLVTRLDRQTWAPHVYCLGPKGHFVEPLEQAGIGVTCLNGRGIVSLPRVLVQLTWALRRQRPVLLQTFLFHANIVGRLAGTLARVPKIISGIRVAERRSLWHCRLDRWTNGLVNHNICVSQGVADYSIQFGGLRPDKVSVIPNGIDVTELQFVPAADLAPLGIPTGTFVFLTVGRLDQQKGLDVLLHAVSKLQGSHDDCRFLIVGDGPERDSLLRLSADLGISARVHFLGHRGDVPNLLRAANAFVLPSRWEGMSNSLLEAMAMGLPVIATAVEGTVELVRDHDTGMLIPPDDSAALAGAIKLVLDAPERAATLGENAQSLISKCYTLDSFVSAYDDFYRRVLSKSHF